MITVTGARKTFGDFVALDDVALEIPAGIAHRAARAERVGQVDAAALDRRARAASTPASSSSAARDVTGLAAAEARHRLRLPALRRLQAHDRARQRRLRADHPQAAQGPRSSARSTSCSRSSGSTAFQHRYPAQLSGGQRQRMALARALAVDPEVLLLDEPFGALDAKVRADLRQWLRRLHDEVHVTTVLVTHDQEEALDVADRIAVLNQGRIEQVGDPVALYDRPANDFVMSFLGLGGPARRPARPAARHRPRPQPGRGAARTTLASPGRRASSRRSSSASCGSGSRCGSTCAPTPASGSPPS